MPVEVFSLLTRQLFPGRDVARQPASMETDLEFKKTKDTLITENYIPINSQTIKVFFSIRRAGLLSYTILEYCHYATLPPVRVVETSLL